MFNYLHPYRYDDITQRSLRNELRIGLNNLCFHSTVTFPSWHTAYMNAYHDALNARRDGEIDVNVLSASIGGPEEVFCPFWSATTDKDGRIAPPPRALYDPYLKYFIPDPNNPGSVIYLMVKMLPQMILSIDA
eukprot:UN08043